MIDQLISIYLNEESWHKYKLSEEDASRYFKKLIAKNRIIVYQKDLEVLGYIESWRINYEQFGRIVCGELFSAFEEDVETGNICYVANTWIHRDHRRGHIYKWLRNAYFEQNKDCDYFVGDARRKKTGLIKVFDRHSIFLKGRNDYGQRKSSRKTNSTTANQSADYAKSYA